MPIPMTMGRKPGTNCQARMAITPRATISLLKSGLRFFRGTVFGCHHGLGGLAVSTELARASFRAGVRNSPRVRAKQAAKLD